MPRTHSTRRTLFTTFKTCFALAVAANADEAVATVPLIDGRSVFAPGRRLATGLHLLA